MRIGIEGEGREEKLGKGYERLPSAPAHSQKLMAKGVTVRVCWKRESFLGEVHFFRTKERPSFSAMASASKILAPSTLKEPPPKTFH